MNYMRLRLYTTNRQQRHLGKYIVDRQAVIDVESF